MNTNAQELSVQRFSNISCKPIYHLILITTVIAIAETAVIFVFSFLPQLSLYQRGMLGGISSIIITFPLLYFTLLKPRISERQCAEDEIKASESKYRSLVESTEDSIYMVDKDYKYLFINRNHVTRMGFSGNEYMGRSYGEFHSPEETNLFHHKVDKIFRTGTSVRREHKSLRDGRHFLQTLSPVRGSNGNITAVMVVSKEITELKAMEDQLHILSMSDELTGLYNRRGFFELIDHHMKRARREKRELFMLYADLDDLKGINDTFGHKEGDKVIADAANILKTTYRDSDIIARIGGDEFVVFPLRIDNDDIETVVSRLKNGIEEYNNMMQNDYRLSISVGISRYDPEYTRSVDELLAQADILMYQHKKSQKRSCLK